MMERADEVIVEPGKEYLVPCVSGVPVTLPAHVDEGTEGPTGRHYHVDHRFGVGKFPAKVCVSHKPVGSHLTARICRFEGEPKWEAREHKSIWHPSGEVFTSTLYLYLTLGSTPSRDGHCAHHGTKLGMRHGCLVCPNHGLQYKLDGSPRFKFPFWLCIQDCRVPLDMKTRFSGLKGNPSGMIIRLEDANGEIITWERLDSLFKLGYDLKEDDTLNISFNAWSENPCLEVTNE